MSDNTYSGSLTHLEQELSGIISPAELQALLESVGIKSDYTVDLTNGASAQTVPSMTDLVLVNDLESIIKELNLTAPNSDGGFDSIGQLATYLTTTDPVLIAPTSSAFVELQGPATVNGALASTFIVDASHDTSSVDEMAGAGQSFLLGGQGPGSDTMSGSTSSSGQAVLVAGSASTTMTGGLGNDVLIGGGHTTMTGGSGAGQLLEEFNTSSNDDITTGTGGGDIIAISQANTGSNTINDGPGFNDSIYAGSGLDTIYGSTDAGGSNITLYQGDSSVVSATSDTINIAKATISHGDTITAGTGQDNVTFDGYSAQAVMDLVTAAEKAPGFSGDDVTIKFATVGGVSQTATLNNVSHITFHNG